MLACRRGLDVVDEGDVYLDITTQPGAELSLHFGDHCSGVADSGAGAGYHSHHNMVDTFLDHLELPHAEGDKAGGVE